MKSSPTPFCLPALMDANLSHHSSWQAGDMDEGQLESSSEEGSSLDEPSWVSWFCMLRNHEFFCEVDPAFVQDRFNLYGLKEVVGPLYGEAMTMILGYAPTGPLPRAPSTHAGRSICTKPGRGPLLSRQAGRGGLLGGFERARVGADTDTSHLPACPLSFSPAHREATLRPVAAHPQGARDGARALRTHPRTIHPNSAGAERHGKRRFCTTEFGRLPPCASALSAHGEAAPHTHVHASHSPGTDAVCVSHHLLCRVQKAKFKASEFGACPRTLCEKQTVLPVGLSDSVSLSGENPMKLFCARW